MIPTFKPIKKENRKGRITPIPEIIFARSETELKTNMNRNNFKNGGSDCKNIFNRFHTQSG